MIWKGILCGLAFVVIAFLVGWFRQTIRIVRLQNLLENEWDGFMGYLMNVSSYTKEWDYDANPIPGAMRLVYRSFGVNQTMYLKYNGSLPIMKAIDKLISDYRSTRK